MISIIYFVFRNATIEQNEFVWIGDSAMASWGTTIDNRISQIKRERGKGRRGGKRGGSEKRGKSVRREAEGRSVAGELQREEFLIINSCKWNRWKLPTLHLSSVQLCSRERHIHQTDVCVDASQDRSNIFRGKHILQRPKVSIVRVTEEGERWWKSKEVNNFYSFSFFYYRAGININDGFGGGNELVSNLLFNQVRETYDHGPFNSWDRGILLL